MIAYPVRFAARRISLSNFIEMRRSAISPVGTTKATTIRGTGIDVLVQRYAPVTRQRVVPTARERNVLARRRRL
jgi:hypothetical protein